MPRNMTSAELAALQSLKTDFGTIKNTLIAAEGKLRALASAEHAANNFHEELAVMRVHSHVIGAWQEMQDGHSIAMEAMLALFTDGNVVIQGGGGGR
jgi:hypothetical protein